MVSWLISQNRLQVDNYLEFNDSMEPVVAGVEYVDKESKYFI